MSDTGIAALDGATQQVNIWLNELDQNAHLDSKRQAYRLLRATLHALRDWVNPDQAADLGAQLPTLIRGIYYEGWNPSATPRNARGKDDFVAHVQSNFDADPLRNPDLAIGAVFALLNKHVGSGQLAQMRNSLQKPLRALWPEAF
jgi:uncharacterized protein (DUF2267 family)